MHRSACFPLVTLLLYVGVGTTLAQGSFFNFETAHVNPIDIAASGNELYVVNTPDNRVERFDLSSGTPVWTDSIHVGVEPVTVRALSSSEIWVVNHISDTISIANLASNHVTKTLHTGSQPADVVFAGGQAFVSCSQDNEIWVYDLANLDAAPTIVPIDGEEPRALDLGALRFHQIAKVVDRNMVDVLGRIPAHWQCPRHRHPPTEHQRRAGSPVCEVGKRDESLPPHPQQLVEHHVGTCRGLKRLAQDRVVERLVGIVREVAVGISLNH